MGLDHPEARFSPSNSPHLTPALELDDLIMSFSEHVAAKGLPTTVNSEADLTTLITALSEEVKGSKLWQYYVIDTQSEKGAVKACLTGPITPWDSLDVSRSSSWR